MRPRRRPGGGAAVAWQGARHGGAGLVGRHAERREALARAWPKARFAAEAERVVGSLPAWFRERVENVAFFVAEWPSSEVLREMGIEDPLDLLGLYRGVPLPERGGGRATGTGSSRTPSISTASPSSPGAPRRERMSRRASARPSCTSSATTWGWTTRRSSAWRAASDKPRRRCRLSVEGVKFPGPVWIAPCKGGARRGRQRRA